MNNAPPRASIASRGYNQRGFIDVATYAKWMVAVVATVGLVLCGMTASAQDAKGDSAYKIGVVDMAKVLKDYNKRQAKYNELQAKVDELQKDIDALSKKIEAAKKDFEDKKATMTEEARMTAKNAIEADYQKYRTELDSRQRQIDNMEEAVLLEVMKDVRAAIEEIAKAGGYHLILNGNEDGKGTVLYHSTTIEITSQVLTKLNGK